jgi:cell division initiation protein
VKVNPMDIQKQIFGKRWRGYDRDEVRTYLNYLAEEFALLQRERDSLSQEVQTFHALVDDYRSRETILKNTLLTTQRLTEEMKENARKQAEAVVHEAEIKAERLIDLARDRAHEVETSVLDLKTHRQALRADIRTIVDRITSLLALQEEAEAEDNLSFLRRHEA